MKRVCSFLLAVLLLSYGYAYYEKSGTKLVTPHEYVNFYTEKKDTAIAWLDRAGIISDVFDK